MTFMTSHNFTRRTRASNVHVSFLFTLPMVVLFHVDVSAQVFSSLPRQET
jgi:hypothetical protein